MPHLTNLDVQFVSLVDRAAVRDPVQQSEPMRFLVWKRDPNAPEGGSMTPEDQKAALEKAQTDLTATQDELTKAQATNAELEKRIKALEAAVAQDAKDDTKKSEPVEVDKSDWPESARVAFEKAEQERQADRQRAEKAEQDAAEASEIAKAERETRLTSEYIAKAETFKALPVEAAKFGPVLKAASEKLSADEAAELDRVLKAADAAMVAGDVFGESGRSREGDTPDSALAEATEKAEEIRKSDTSLSQAGALKQAFAADPGLAARYQDELRAR